MLTNSQRSRLEAAATTRLRSSPRRPFIDVVRDVAHEVAGIRVVGHVEDADAETQSAWFEIAAMVAAARVTLLRAGRLGLADELRGLLRQ